MEDHYDYPMCFGESDGENTNQIDYDQIDTRAERDCNELLIELVKNYPHLYDKKNCDFKDAVMKNNSWDEIGKVLNMAGIVLFYHEQ